MVSTSVPTWTHRDFIRVDLDDDNAYYFGLVLLGFSIRCLDISTKPHKTVEDMAFFFAAGRLIRSIPSEFPEDECLSINLDLPLLDMVIFAAECYPVSLADEKAKFDALAVFLRKARTDLQARP